VAASTVDVRSSGQPTIRQPELAVSLERVTKRFDDVIAVNDISLNVARGSLVGVIGPSGAGKTTTIRMISGGLTPDHGSVRVLGEDPRHFKRRTRESIGYMPQLFVLYPDLTVKENVNFMASLFGINPWHRERRIRDALEMVELWDVRGRRASQLSGGMQRRLELACALVHQPSLLILDEPTAGIDPLLRASIWEEINRRRDAGVTVLVTTQYVTEAEYCDAVALISDGRLIAYATPADLRRLALGGDVIEVETRDPVDAGRIPAIPGVGSIRQTGPRSLLVVAQDAGVASPKVIEAVEQAGTTVEVSREYRPSFDEVFAALVTGDADQRVPAASGSGPTEVVQ
jgi:ABC-2 type transport system ATP-binding protein